MDGMLQASAALVVMLPMICCREKCGDISEKKRKREGREKGKNSAVLAHGFVVQGSRWSRYWEVSTEQFRGSGGELSRGKEWMR
jgi:hypothetical protein